MNQAKLSKYLAPDPADPCWLAEMKKHIGGPQDQYYDYCDADVGEAWCACGLNFMLHLCGIKGTGSAAAYSFRTWGTPLDGPKVGAIAVFHFSFDTPGHGHVSIVNDINEDEGYIGCIGANQSNQIKRSVYDLDNVLAYRWPPQ